jgi:hypothetical protein
MPETRQLADSTLERDFATFSEELEFVRLESGETAEAAFFRIYAGIAAENGDTIDLVPTPARKDGTGGYRIDGAGFDADRGILYLAIADFRLSPELETLNSAQIESLVKRARRFVDLAIDETFLSGFSESAPEFEAGYPLAFQAATVRRIRIVVFSNARLATRRPPELAAEAGG